MRFPAEEIRYWASRFSDSAEDKAIRRIAPQMKARGYLTRPEFLTLCRWKSARSRRHVERNDTGFIRAATGTALSTPNERLRIEALTLLDGVDWPTASVILHFGHRASYPVLDWRALWALGVSRPPSYSFAFWWGYVQACRRLARKHSCSMRTLDRALWQYSKERQRATAR